MFYKPNCFLNSSGHKREDYLYVGNHNFKKSKECIFNV